ncbi:hypothetical protein SALBM311S_02810 [Streptomyces alboniger]
MLVCWEMSFSTSPPLVGGHSAERDDHADRLVHDGVRGDGFLELVDLFLQCEDAARLVVGLVPYAGHVSILSPGRALATRRGAYGPSFGGPTGVLDRRPERFRSDTGDENRGPRPTRAGHD